MAKYRNFGKCIDKNGKFVYTKLKTNVFASRTHRGEYIFFEKSEDKNMKKQYVLADVSVLPDVFPKVLRAKKLLRSGEAATVHDAVRLTGISRSAYYKYKDHIFPFHEMQGILNLYFELMDIPGTLSEILGIVAKAGCNILTINQTIPINGVASITITLQTEEMQMEFDEMMDALSSPKGVRSMNVLGRQ